MLIKREFIFLLLACVISCSNEPVKTISYEETISDPKAQPFLNEYSKWKGVPYKYGGTSKSGVDCSAFVQSVYISAQSRQLPRTTKYQLKEGYRITLEEAQAGDLLFFKTSKKANHVGIYLGNNTFMHASTSKGVIISRIDNPYWASVFWQIRRVD